MAATILRYILAITIASTAFWASYSIGNSQSAMEDVNEHRPERQVQTLRARQFKIYQDAMELMNAEPPLYDEALNLLLEIDYDKKPSYRIPNAYERAVFFNTIATIYQAQEKYEKAIEYFLLVLEQETELPYDLEDSVNFLVGQMYYILEDYDASLIYLNNWLEPQLAPPSNNLIFIANAYYYAGSSDRLSPENRDEQYRHAVLLTNQAIKIEDANNNQAKENWFVFLRMLYSNLEDDEKVFELSKLLVSRWPGKKEYWSELSGLYARLTSEDGLSEDQIKSLEMNQLVAYEMAHRQELLTRSRELEIISQLFLYHEIPYKSAKVMSSSMKQQISQENFKNLDLLSQGYIQAKDLDKAIEPLSKAAALSENGEHYMRLANLYLQLDQYDFAADAIEKALEKSGISRPDLARFLQGQAYIALEKFDDARTSFRLAAEDERTNQNAMTWLKYIDREEKRIKDIEEYLN